MKHKRLALFCGLALLGSLAVGCGAIGTQPRGWAHPVESDDHYLVSTARGRIDGIDTSTLRAEWRFPDFWNIIDSDARRLQGLYGAPVVANDGDTVFLADYNGYIYTFRMSQAITPEQNRVLSRDEKPTAGSFRVRNPVIGGIALDEPSETLFVTSGRRLQAVNSADLVNRIGARDATVRIRFSFEAENDIWGAPVIAGNRVLVSSVGGSLYALDSTNGNVLWSFDSGAGLVSTPVVANNLVLAGGFNSRLYAVDLATGEERWSFQASHWVWSAPRVDGSNLVFGDFSGRVYSLNAANGAVNWALSLDRGPIVASPLVAGNTIVVTTEEGWAFGIDRNSRQISWQREIGSRITADPVLSGNRVLIAPSGCVTPEGQDNRVYYIAIDPTTGNLEQALDIC